MNGHFQIRLIFPVLKYLIEFRKKLFDRSCVWAISGRIDRTGMCDPGGSLEIIENDTVTT